MLNSIPDMVFNLKVYIFEFILNSEAIQFIIPMTSVTLYGNIFTHLL